NRGIDLTPLLSAGMQMLPSTGPARFQGALGLATIDLRPPPIDGRCLKYLRNLTELQSLRLPNGMSVTDADLQCLTRINALTSLELHDPRITDAGVKSLEHMTWLKVLSLEGTQVTGAGLEHIHAMTALASLDLGRTRVEQLAPIAHLSR